MAERKKPGWAFLLTIAFVGLPLLYVVSFGPACWVSSRMGRGAFVVDVAFQPIMRLAYRGPAPISGMLKWYTELGAAEHWALDGAEKSDSVSWEENAPPPTPPGGFSDGGFF